MCSIRPGHPECFLQAATAPAADVCTWSAKPGDVLEGRVACVSVEGLWLDIGQHSFALLAKAEIDMLQLQYISVGDDLEDLRVVAVSCDGQVELVSLLSHTPECTAEDPMPASEFCRSEMETLRSSEIHKQEATACRYTLPMLLRMRSTLRQRGDVKGECMGFLTVASYPQEDLDHCLIDFVSRGQLPARWARCSLVAKRKALLMALRDDHMHIVFAMQPCSEQFREELTCVDLDADFLAEAMQFVCAGNGKPHCAIPRACVSWLLEQGASAAPLLPSNNVSARLAGLRVLRELGSAAAICVIEVLSCYDDSDSRVRCAVFEAVGSMGGAVRDVVASRGAFRTMKQQQEDFRVRQAAAHALGRLGNDGLVLAVRALSHKSMEVRALGAQALREGEAAAAPLGADILTCWLDPDSAEATTEHAPLRLAAVQALGSMGAAAGNAAIEALARTLSNDADDNVREAAAVALGQAGNAAMIHMEVIAAALDDDCLFVQRAATAALEAVSQPA